VPGGAVYEAHGVVTEFGELLGLGVKEDDLVCLFWDVRCLVGGRDGSSEVEMLGRWDKRCHRWGW
jgi:hypothetical protein